MSNLMGWLILGNVAFAYVIWDMRPSKMAKRRKEAEACEQYKRDQAKQDEVDRWKRIEAADTSRYRGHEWPPTS